MLSRITALVMLTLLIPLSAVQAQGSNSLTYGQTVAGTLTDREFRTVYTFNAAAGDTIDVILTRTDGDLDPVLILMDDQSAVIAIDDDSATGYDASLISVRLPRDGVYFLIVTRFGQEIGLTTGGYSLTLTRAGIAADSVGSDRVLRYGDSVIGELNNDEFQRVYIFTANRGDVITITMRHAGCRDQRNTIAAIGRVCVGRNPIRARRRSESRRVFAGDLGTRRRCDGRITGLRDLPGLQYAGNRHHRQQHRAPLLFAASAARCAVYH
jgi:hypothetical protein